MIQNFAGSQLLVVDDDFLHIETLKQVLRDEWNLDSAEIVRGAKNGKEAIEIVKEDLVLNEHKYSSFKLILIKCEIPGINGFDATM